jgi:hypothetical protein
MRSDLRRSIAAKPGLGFWDKVAPRRSLGKGDIRIRAARVIKWVLLGYLALCLPAYWLGLGSDDRPRVREGEACGLGYPRTYLRSNATDPELSCERE